MNKDYISEFSYEDIFLGNAYHITWHATWDLIGRCFMNGYGAIDYIYYRCGVGRLSPWCFYEWEAEARTGPIDVKKLQPICFKNLIISLPDFGQLQNGIFNDANSYHPTPIKNENWICAKYFHELCTQPPGKKVKNIKKNIIFVMRYLWHIHSNILYPTKEY